MGEIKSFSAFWGCNIPVIQPFAEKAARLIFKKLDLELLDIIGATCCPENDLVRRIDTESAVNISGANFALAELNRNEDMVTFCNGCYHSLSHAYHVLENDEKLKELNDNLEELGSFASRKTKLSFDRKIKLFSLVDFLVNKVGIDKIKENISNPLSNLKVAAHYGCRLFEGDLPQYFDQVIEVSGATQIKYGLERMCCGVPALYTDQMWSIMERARNKILAAKRAEADVIVVSCPACFKQFENAQLLLKRQKEIYNIPILHITELLALSFGFKPEEIGMKEHKIAYKINEE